MNRKIDELSFKLTSTNTVTIRERVPEEIDTFFVVVKRV